MGQGYVPYDPDKFERVQYRPLTEEEKAMRASNTLAKMPKDTAAFLQKEMNRPGLGVNRGTPSLGLPPVAGPPGLYGMSSANERPGAERANSLLEAAAKYGGVDLTTGLQGEGRSATGFAANKELAAQYLRNNGYEAMVDPTLGLLYRNPDTGYLTTVDEETITGGDLRDMAPALVKFLPELAGGVTGLLLSGGTPAAPFATATGSAAGAAIGERARHAIAERYGVPEPTNMRERWQKAGKTAFAWGLGADTAVSFGSGLKSVIFQPELALADPSYLREIVRASEFQGNKTLADDINRVLQDAGSDLRFNPTPGMMSGDQKILSLEQDLRRSHAALRFSELDRTNQNALEAYLDIVNPRPAEARLRDSSIGVDETGADVIEVIAEDTRKKLALAEKNIELAEKQGRYFVSNTLDAMQPETVGLATRRQLQLARDEAKMFEDARYRQLRNLYGYDEVSATALPQYRIAWTKDMSDVITRLNRESESALFVSDVTAKQKLTGRLSQHQDVHMVNRNGDIVASFKVGDPIDFDAALRGLQHLRRLRRARSDNPATDPIARDIGILERSIKDAMDQRLSYLGASGDPNAFRIQAAMKDAENLARYRARTFDRGVIGDILQKDPAGGYVMQNREVMQQALLSGNREAIREIANVAGRDPLTKREFKRLVFATYRQEVAPNGVPDLALHEKFVRNHGALIDEFFPQNASKLKDEFGSFSKTINEEMRALDMMMFKLDKATNGRLVKAVKSPEGQILVQSKVNGESFADMVISGSLNGANVRDIRGILMGAGQRDMWFNWQRALSEQIRGKLIRGKGASLSTSRLETLLNNSSGIRETFGSEYIRNLQQIRDALVLMGRDAPGNTGDIFSRSIYNASKVVARPLSRLGLARNAVRVIRLDYANNVMADILSDPKKLSLFMELRGANKMNRRAASILTSLGMTGFENLPVFSDEEINASKYPDDPRAP